MKKIITILILALASQGVAHAQLGGLLNKAKDAVKKEAKKTVEKKTEQTETKLSDQAGVQTASSTAPAAVNATDIDPHLGVSMSQLKASYDQLDPKIYFTLFRREPEFFYANSGSETNNLFMYQRTILAWQMSSGKESPPVVYEWGKGFPGIPAEFIINANFAVFKAFPKQAYPLFLEARTLLRAMESGKIRVDVEDASTICGYKKGDELFFKASPDKKYGFGYKRGLIEYIGDVNAPASDMIKHWKAEEARLMKLYNENTPFESVKNTFFNTMVESVNLSKQQNWGYGLYKGYQLDVAAQDMKTHPRKVEDKDYKDGLASYEKLSKDNYPKWEKHIKSQWMDILEAYDFNALAKVPKAAISNPKLEAEMIAIARTIYEDGRVPVKAVIKYPDWNYTRNAFGAIIDRYHTAFIIFKMKDGTHRMVDIGFKQLYNGGSYGKTQLRGIGTNNLTVEYP